LNVCIVVRVVGGFDDARVEWGRTGTLHVVHNNDVTVSTSGRRPPLLGEGLPGYQALPDRATLSDGGLTGVLGARTARTPNGLPTRLIRSQTALRVSPQWRMKGV